MKSVAFAIFVYSMPLLAQEPLEFSDIVELDSLTIEELHARALTWIAESFVSPKNVLEIDQESHIMCKGAMDYYPSEHIKYKNSVTGVIYFTLHIYLKDSRYKCDITNLSHKAFPAPTIFGDPGAGNDFNEITREEIYAYPKGAYSKKSRNDVWNDIKHQAWLGSKGIFDSLKKSMEKGQEDW